MTGIGFPIDMIRINKTKIEMQQQKKKLEKITLSVIKRARERGR